MNIIHRVRVSAILLIIINDVAFTNADNPLDFFRENQVSLFERIRKLEENDSKKQQEIKLLQDRVSIKQLEIESLNLQMKELKDGIATNSNNISSLTGMF